MNCVECGGSLEYVAGVDTQPHGETREYEGYRCARCGAVEDVAPSHRTSTEILGAIATIMSAPKTDRRIA